MKMKAERELIAAALRTNGCSESMIDYVFQQLLDRADCQGGDRASEEPPSDSDGDEVHLLGVERFGALDQKVQAKFDRQSRLEIALISAFFRIPGSEVIRTAFRVYRWARQQVAKGRDVGAYEPERGTFVAYDIPYALPPVPMRGVPDMGSVTTEGEKQDATHAKECMGGKEDEAWVEEYE